MGNVLVVNNRRGWGHVIGLLTVIVALLATSPGFAQHSAARIWNEENLFAIRRDRARPPIHARNLFHVSVAMWDAWAAYDPAAEGYLVKEKMAPPENVLDAREEAISFAAYRVLKHRFAGSPGAVTTNAELDGKMDELGYEKTFTSTEGGTPAALGNRIAAAIIAWGLLDNSNEAGGYAANNGYTPVNEPLPVDLIGNPLITNPNRWQPLAFEVFIDQSGNIFPGSVPPFIAPHWGYVTPFCLRERDRSDFGVHFDPGPPPYWGTDTHEEYVDTFITNILYSSHLDPNDGVTMDISPGARGNNSPGLNDGTGYPSNPFTGLPYEPQIVKRGDWGRVIAEFWADGPDSETPPGHWNTVANFVSDSPDLEKRIGGEGEIVDDLEWDVKLYLALNGAEHDIAIGVWGMKSAYDSIRPISAIRFLCDQGQASDPEAPNYDPLGMPLIPGLIEQVTEESSAPGERHEEFSTKLGDIVVLSWKGQPANPATEFTGVGWIECGAWMPYQRPTFVTPPFAGYVSGHSSYSGAAAEVLTRFTGSAYFPGGIGEFPAPQNEFLVFEEGPSEDIVMQWATYYDAADESGLSRIYGGIHPPIDDAPGRIIGYEIGAQAFHEATQYWAGNASKHSADSDGTPGIDLSELLRVVQLYNGDGYRCGEGADEDGYLMGASDVPQGGCIHHDSDFAPKDYNINLSEVLRIVQFYNLGVCVYCMNVNPATEDSFCAS